MLIDFPIIWVESYLLTLFRILGLLVTVPFLGDSQIPIRVKISLAVLISLIIWPIVSESYVPAGEHGIWHWLGMVFHESFLGLFLGFIIRLLMMGVQFAGQLIGFQMGFGIVSVLDPQSGQQQSLIANFK